MTLLDCLRTIHRVVGDGRSGRVVRRTRRRGVRGRFVTLAAAAMPVACALSGCRSPTEISVIITTEFPCSDLRQVTVTIGPLGDDFERHTPPTSIGTTCNGGYVGTLVVVPSGAKDEQVGIKVVAGFATRNAEQCAPSADSPPVYGPGCIVARRALRYIPHSPLRVPIVLRSSCDGIACGVTETCESGKCVQAKIADPSSCAKPSGCPASADPGDSVAATCGDMRGLQAGAPWPMSGYCPTRRSRSPYVGAQSAAVKWSFLARPATDVSIAADGTLYFGGGDGQLHAVDPSGAEKWAFPTTTTAPVTGAPAIAADGTVYFGAGDHNLYAVTPGGEKKWYYAATEFVSAATIGGDGTVYFCSRDAVVHAVDGAGKKVWEMRVGGSEMRDSQPVLSVDGKTLYVPDFDGKLYALTTATGEPVWMFNTGGITVTPAVGPDGTIYVGSADKHLYAVTADGNLRWSLPTGDAVGAPPAIGANGIVYTTANDGKLYAIDSQGKLVWSFPTTRLRGGGPSVGADGTIYFMAADGSGGDLFALDARGKAKWSANDNATLTPAIGADGTVYGDVSAYGR